jgi:hypothetical protein
LVPVADGDDADSAEASSQKIQSCVHCHRGVGHALR